MPPNASATESPRGRAQPPCAKPSRRSSSGRPGACITPSSVKCISTTTLLIVTPFYQERAFSPSIRTALAEIDRGCGDNSLNFCKGQPAVAHIACEQLRWLTAFGGIEG